jgi:hypothetical protein
MSRYLGVGGWVVTSAVLAWLAGCAGSAPSKPDGGGGKGGGGTTGSAGGGAGGSSDAGVDGPGDSASTAGAGGASAAGGGSGGTAGGTAGSIGMARADGGVDATGAAGADGGVAGPDGGMASCVKALVGRYLLRTDGALLYEAEPPSTMQTPVLDGTTGLPLVGLIGVQEGADHGCAVQASSHSAWCWRTGAGGNKYGQLGNGMTDALTTAFQATQVLTAANTPLTNVATIANTEVPDPTPSGGASCAVTTDGKIYCWGSLSYLLNGGTTLASAFAVPVTTDGVTPFTGALQLGLFDGGFSACAIVQGTASKELWCWGLNGSGNLGLGDQMTRRYPTKVLGINNPMKVVMDGIYDPHGLSGTTCVLDGSNVRCWGQNTEGDVATGVATGNFGSVVLAPSLVTLMGTTPLDNVVDLHGGTLVSFSSFCALTTSSSMLCWGYVGVQVAQPYPTTFAVSNVAAIGGTGSYIRYLTDDGMYHFGTTSDHAGTTRAPSCGPLH